MTLIEVVHSASCTEHDIDDGVCTVCGVKYVKVREFDKSQFVLPRASVQYIHGDTKSSVGNVQLSGYSTPHCELDPNLHCVDDVTTVDADSKYDNINMVEADSSIAMVEADSKYDDNVEPLESACNLTDNTIPVIRTIYSKRYSTSLVAFFIFCHIVFLFSYYTHSGIQIVDILTPDQCALT
jgi:hypothetical protein